MIKSPRMLPYHSVSFTIHLMIVIMAYLYSSLVVDNSKTKVDLSKSRIVGKSIRVDVVAMPKLTIQELKQMSDAAPGTRSNQPQIKEATSGGDENTVFNKESKEKSFAEKLKELSQRKTKTAKKLVKKKEAETGNNGIRGQRLKKILAMGNKISSGESIYGDHGGNSGDLFDLYAIKVTDLVRQNWRLPAYLADKGFRCTIQLFISQSGKLLNAKVISSSASSDYDDFALSAIKKVGAFPKPDNKIARRVVSGEIALGFPL